MVPAGLQEPHYREGLEQLVRRFAAVRTFPSSTSYNIVGVELRPLADKRRRDLVDRFWSRVEIGDEDDCWLWTGSTNGNYGITRVDGLPMVAHRVAWTLAVGRIPGGRQVHHKCEMKLCCNPHHLEVLSRSAHAQRHPQPPLTACRTCGGELTLRHSGGKTYRACRACDAARKRKRRFDPSTREHVLALDREVKRRKADRL